MQDEIFPFSETNDIRLLILIYIYKFNVYKQFVDLTNDIMRRKMGHDYSDLNFQITQRFYMPLSTLTYIYVYS